ncbi:MAG: ATP-binding protein [Armatimonadetes bacterium]|nr:ATP-binding protein [Armatimonadota bacterium]
MAALDAAQSAVVSGAAELAVPADAAYLELVGQFVSFLARRRGFDEQVVARIRLAVDEACANALDHGRLVGDGNDGNDAPLRVVCESTADGLRIRVRDRGRAFDPATLAAPLVGAPLEKRRIGGLGVYLMRRIMDSVEVWPTDDGKELVLTKCLDSGKVVAGDD